MSNLPFDLQKISDDHARHQKRWQMFLWSIPAVIFLLLLAIWLILPGILTGRALNAYNHGAYKIARQWIAPLTLTSPEPFVAAYNSGTFDSADGTYDRAEKELTRALALAPQDMKCKTAQNLVFTLRAHSLSTPDATNNATAYLKQSANIISAHPTCFKAAASSGGASSQSSSSGNSQAPSDSQQQELQQKEQAGRDRKAKFARDEEYNATDPSVKLW